jgi:serine protease Do
MSTTIERYVIRHISGSKINQVEEFDFSKAELSIGRAANCEIQFDPEKEVIVSREHGKIVKNSSEPPKFAVVDNNSRNGIFVNKSRVKGVAELHPGDEVQLGNNGPIFSFDIYPRPQDMMMATRIVEIPTTIKPTTISEIQATEVVNMEPVKTGLGKQTVERMLVAERKKSYSSMAFAIGGLVILMGVLGYSFRDKLFGRKTTIVQSTTTVIKDSANINKKTPGQISAENTDRVVQIEFGWQLFDATSSDEIWHEYSPVNGPGGVKRLAGVFIENSLGKIEPYIDVKNNIRVGASIGIQGNSGSGFIVSEDGFILTARHLAAAWHTRYNFIPASAFPGILVRVVNGREVTVPNVQVLPQDVFGWVPAEATMIGGRPIIPGTIKGRNTYMNVVFAGTALRRPVQSSTPSDNHDVALIKVEIPRALSPVTMKDSYKEIQPGASVSVMGYPGVAPEQFVVRPTNDPFNNVSQFTSVPTPTITPGSIGRIIPASSAKDLRYSTAGDSYQLTINATGMGNSGGPLFDDEGNVVGIYYAGSTDPGGTQISFAVPIKYGLELMGPVKVGGTR